MHGNIQIGKNKTRNQTGSERFGSQVDRAVSRIKHQMVDCATLALKGQDKDLKWKDQN